jgi:transcription antitermination factor NusG
MMLGLQINEAPVPCTTQISASEAKPETPRWYAIRTRGRCEKRVVTQLRERGFEAFLPLYSEVRRWSDRRKVLDLPLFPGYTFLRTFVTAEMRLLILRTAGVLSFVGSPGSPQAIPDREIDDVQLLLARRVPFRAHAFLNSGTRVRIRGGALDGIEGILIAKNSDCSLIVSVELIRRSIALRVQGYDVCPV